MTSDVFSVDGTIEKCVQDVQDDVVSMDGPIGNARQGFLGNVRSRIFRVVHLPSRLPSPLLIERASSTPTSRPVPAERVDANHHLLFHSHGSFYDAYIQLVCVA